MDYGNRTDGLAPGDIYSWQPLLDLIPHQAVCCVLAGAPKETNWEEEMWFSSLLVMSSPMKINVKKVN